MAVLNTDGEAIRRAVDTRTRELAARVSNLALRASIEGESILSLKYHEEALRILRALPRYHRFWHGFVERNFALPH